MISATLPERRPDQFRNVALAMLLGVFAYRSTQQLWLIAHTQPFGTDFSCFWAGAKAALSAPSRIYDFRYVTQLQGWPLGHQVRPFVYPPSALVLFLPLAAAPMAWAYAAFISASGALYLAASRKAGAPWWLLLLPVVWLVVACGQVTFAVGGLALLGLVLRARPILAGVLLGLAAAIKPQLCLLLPLGLLADRRWVSLAAAGATCLALTALSAAMWGPHIWLDWLAALRRFQAEVVPSIPGLRGDELSPAAVFEQFGLPAPLGLVFAPFAVWLAWRTFRDSPDPLRRASAAFGGALLLSPYAMNYDAGVLAPGVAALLMRRDDKLWPLYAATSMLFAISVVRGPGALIAGLVPPVLQAFAPARAAQPAGQDQADRDEAAQVVELKEQPTRAPG
jgi:hypothetical protein